MHLSLAVHIYNDRKIHVKCLPMKVKIRCKTAKIIQEGQCKGFKLTGANTHSLVPTDAFQDSLKYLV